MALDGVVTNLGKMALISTTSFDLTSLVGHQRICLFAHPRILAIPATTEEQNEISEKAEITAVKKLQMRFLHKREEVARLKRLIVREKKRNENIIYFEGISVLTILSYKDHMAKK